MSLAERVEAAGVDEQRAMLEEAFAYIHKMDDGLTPADWSALNWPFADRFTAKLDAEAYESAAMMLVPTDGSMRIAELSLAWEPDRPEVWPAVVLRWYPPCTEVDGKSWHCRITSAATPALALAAAAIRAGAK